MKPSVDVPPELLACTTTANEASLIDAALSTLAGKLQSELGPPE